MSDQTRTELAVPFPQDTGEVMALDEQYRREMADFVGLVLDHAEQIVYAVTDPTPDTDAPEPPPFQTYDPIIQALAERLRASGELEDVIALVLALAER